MLISELDSRMKNVHVGRRWKELCEEKNLASASVWVPILKVKDRNQIHYRWKSESMDVKELILICEKLNITLHDFFDVDADSLLAESPAVYKKPFIEERLEILERELLSLKRTVNLIPH